MHLPSRLQQPRRGRPGLHILRLRRVSAGALVKTDQIRVHIDDQERLLEMLNRYTQIINALGSALMELGVPEEAVRRLIADA